MENQLQTAVKNYESNVLVMGDKTTKALAALSKIKVINNDEDDKAAQHILSRVKPTFETVQALRKEITDPLDELKSYLMEHEKKISTAKNSGSEYSRVKNLRDAYANKKAAEARAEQQRIQNEKAKKIEIADMKARLVKNIELGVFDLIKDGELQLTKFVSEMTLENFDQKLALLNYKPKLKTDSFSKLMTIDYNKSLVSVAEYEQMIKDGGTQFSYDHINAAYAEQAIKVLNRFKKDVIPARKAELEERSKASADEQKVKKQQEDQMLQARLDEINSAYESEKVKVEEKVDDQTADTKIEAEFDSQVDIQTIKDQKGVRKNIVYQIDEKILAKPSQVIDVLTKVVTHVMMDDKFKGVIKRDAQGFPRVDDKGQTELVDGIQYWLKELAKLKIDIDVDGLIKTENISTTIRS